MAVLMSCWFIIEKVIIPDGLRKWFYLSYFINPSILFFCQIFLWLKLIKDGLVTVLLVPLRVSYVSCLYITGVVKKCVVSLYSIIIRRPRVHEEAEQYFEAESTFDSDRVVPGLYITSLRPEVKLLEFEAQVPDEGTDNTDYEARAELFICDATSSNNEDSFSSTDSLTSDDENNSDDGFLHQENREQPLFYGGEFAMGKDSSHANEYLSGVPRAGFVPVETEATQIDEDQDQDQGQDQGEEEIDEEDELYKTYSESMRWFDVLNYDRTCGISAIENMEIRTPSPFRSIEYPGYYSGSRRTPRAKMTTKNLMRCLENDFEVVYVAQACLTWKALHHQYMKLKGLERSSSQNGTYCSYVAGEFQKFLVLLERFMEDEQSEGERVWNFVNGRFSLKGLLQVPEVSVKGLLKEEKEEKKGGYTNIKGVLKVIEDCIEAFWLFVKTDNTKKSWWQIATSSLAYPPVEDPRDLELLSQLTKTLQKNKLGLKDLEGKRRCLLKRIANPIEECQRKEMLFTMIDMKLVSRVLQMPLISSPQLKWCQQKLDNVEFKDGKVFRACIDPLFPSN